MAEHDFLVIFGYQLVAGIFHCLEDVFVQRIGVPIKDNPVLLEPECGIDCREYHENGDNLEQRALSEKVWCIGNAVMGCHNDDGYHYAEQYGEIDQIFEGTDEIFHSAFDITDTKLAIIRTIVCFGLIFVFLVPIQNCETIWQN